MAILSLILALAIPACLAMDENSKPVNLEKRGTKWSSVVSIQVFPLNAKRAAHHCAGTILTENAILTSASCFATAFEDHIHTPDVLQLERYTIKAAVRTESVPIETKQPTVVGVFPHEEFTNVNANNVFRNDIAIVKVDPPMNMNSPSTFVNLPDENMVLSKGTNCSIGGWGVSSMDLIMKGKLSHDNLQKAKVEIVKRDNCKTMYKRQLPENMICAGLKKTDEFTGQERYNSVVNSCSGQGDRGGALFCAKEAGSKVKAQYGIISYTKQCEDYDTPAPGVYTDVRKFVGWIKETLESSDFKAANNGRIARGSAMLWRFVDKAKVKLEPVVDAIDSLAGRR